MTRRDRIFIFLEHFHKSCSAGAPPAGCRRRLAAKSPKAPGRGFNPQPGRGCATSKLETLYCQPRIAAPPKQSGGTHFQMSKNNYKPLKADNSTNELTRLTTRSRPHRAAMMAARRFFRRAGKPGPTPGRTLHARRRPRKTNIVLYNVDTLCNIFISLVTGRILTRFQYHFSMTVGGLAGHPLIHAEIGGQMSEVGPQGGEIFFDLVIAGDCTS